MKKTWIQIFLAVMLGISVAEAQFLEKIGKKVERKVNQRIERKTDKAIDKTLDKAENSIEAQKTKSKADAVKNKNGSSNRGTDETNYGNELLYNSKFDFIPGEKVLFYDDFEQESTGDFPSRWGTNGAGEVVTLRTAGGKWLRIPDNSVSFPELERALPEHFTVEFDLYYPEVGKRPPVTFGFTEVKSPDKDPLQHKNIFYFLIPASVKQAIGYSTSLYSGRETMQEWPVDRMMNKKNHISIAVNGSRIRLYIADDKLFDLPKGFDKAVNRNNFHFRAAQLLPKPIDAFYISNLRIAESGQDARSLLATNGRYSTSGIYFNTGEAVIKAESQGVLKEIGNLLVEKSDLALTIVGHTDNVGSAASNLKLSEERAMAVKTFLSSNFGIAAERLTATGKGQTEPIADNHTVAGKAQNRRVEFLRK